MLKSIPFLFSVIFLLTVSVGCGRNYDEYEVKEYRLTVESPDNTMHQIFSRLIDDYNDDAGFSALNYVSSGAEANSVIVLTQGLHARDGKIGWGQWVKQIEEDNPGLLETQSKGQRTIYYSMRVELDQEYVTSRMHAKDPEKTYELFKLFAHEVGHGFMMNHDPEPQSVMYYEVSGNKDFTTYFQRVRTFFGQ